MVSQCRVGQQWGEHLIPSVEAAGKGMAMLFSGGKMFFRFN
jgi:hypothetical protein